MMISELTLAQVESVESIFSSLSLEEKIGHLIMPQDRKYSPEVWAELASEIPIGAAYLFLTGRLDCSVDEIRRKVEALQKVSCVPIIIAAGMEHGFEGGTVFPRAMACGAADLPDEMYLKGRAVAKEARAYGLHWAFSPAVDLQLNWHNPETNTRSFGDDPERVARLASAQIRGMQADGVMAATAKHFPGAGADDRDQHLCTSFNPLSVEKWRATYGKVFKAVIETGVFTIMPGHIAFPAYEGLEHDPASALPATLNPKLQIDLLRKELGFKGVIISDAAPMVGISGRVPSDEKALMNILSGSDIYLWADPRKDFRLLLRAAKDGRLPLELIDEKVKRIVELKVRLAIHENPFGELPTEDEKKTFTRAAQTIADSGITLQLNDGTLPLKLKPGAKVITTTIYFDRNNRAKKLDIVEEELRGRGFEVEHVVNPSHDDLFEKAAGADHVFVNLEMSNHHLMGVTRLVGNMAMAFWKGFWMDFPGKVTVTSFGSPYHLYEMPCLPNMVLAYGADVSCQRSAVKAWFGEIPADSPCPVKMPYGSPRTLR